ncbi:Phosphomannomutase [hydrothermal vent metagenome]|uniref:Phosphomannomutase n=1 Tax=hydrothermal vent metagenome TaxID=652676 RepID=A0A3B1C9M3_9ZZZZ
MNLFRFQGTDGVRRHVALAKEYPGLFPAQAFIKKDVITEDFMELYCFCAVKWMIDSRIMKEGETIVIGWDPRDKSGKFTSSAIQGAVRAGARVAAVGVMPTPGVVVYMRSIQAAGAIMVTASHNPATYNGIKLFTRSGLKLLPGDDIELSRLVMETDFLDVKMTRPDKKVTDSREEAAQTFIDFSLNPRNSWIDDGTEISKVTLILDCANGAFSELAEPICARAGFGRVIALNNSLDDLVNDNCGVALLEGIKVITHDMIESNGALHGYLPAKTLFDIGRQNADAIKSGDKTLCAAVFDGDGDRFFRVDYDPFTDSCFVLTGDETAILQAEHRKEIDASKLFASSVESDLGVSLKGGELGYKTSLTAVGDKWILLKGILAAIKPNVADDVYSQIVSAASSALPSARTIEKILQDESVHLGTLEGIGFAIGAEESGHNITPGILGSNAGETLVLAGNGIKSLLNTFAATCSDAIMNIGNLESRMNHIKAPFPCGYKKTLYIFYVNKDLWRPDGLIWKECAKAIMNAIPKNLPGAEARETPLDEDNDMLYIKIVKSGDHMASVFIRNSGTEDKIGVTLRGSLDKSGEMLSIGKEAQKILLLKMKDFSKKIAVEERELLSSIALGDCPGRHDRAPGGGEYDKLLNETGRKQGILTEGPASPGLTGLGQWYLSAIKEKKI